MLKTIFRAALVCAAAVSLLATGNLAAQQFPTKILRVVNPNNPGGNSDVLFRLLSPKMGEVLGQQVVIEYRPGAGGNIGAEAVSRSAPDGYTTLIAAASILINPSILKTLPFDVEKDFTPLGVIVDIPAGLVVHPSLPVKSVKDLVALAKRRPGELNYSSSGNGALGHLSGALLGASTGIKAVHIPYKGAGPSIVDLVAGHVEFSFVSLPAISGHLQSGRLRMIAQCGEKRFVSFPNVPTMVESGVKDFVVTSPFSYLGPAGMPKPVVDKLNGALRAALNDPQNNKVLIDRGAQPIGNTPAEHAALIKSEIAKWKRVAQAAGIKPQ
ncbi:MAG: tripartite tricarboxylate transporter substrate binding protein [Betaproteobacteria bacterium]|jgi:tripartite-type tricarboxylate transporter receptor subunit TctC|nr:tripartite tricarboxylate transporter substrate binding protein [Betaproteobacteria bacterium]MDH4292636.1 tripartite tricarboxylate transporter substrate binding protein [Betaproteobacteria bacterium]MDH5343962.1 tripartite tricarboxylate transporter substrate binding protein [Betaproteobacteria bacterium]